MKKDINWWIHQNKQTQMDPQDGIMAIPDTQIKRDNMFAFKRQKKWPSSPQTVGMRQKPPFQQWTTSLAAGADERDVDTSKPNQRVKCVPSGLWKESAQLRHLTCQLNWSGTSMLGFMRTNVSFQDKDNSTFLHTEMINSNITQQGVSFRLL